MNKKYMMRVNFLVFLLFFVCLFCPLQASARGETGAADEFVLFSAAGGQTLAQEETVPREDVIGEAKKGIVEVLSGFTDGNGKFYKMKSASGFLISNGENGAFIVTNAGILKSTNKEKKAFCKENGVKTGSSQLADSVQIVIRGDVTAEAQILTQSGELDFCILSLDSVVNEKSELKLGDSSLPVTGDTVFTLGFPTDITELEFSEEEVEVYQGSIQDKASNQNGEPYIQHSAAVLEGNAGGPLLDAEGYVIGINCFQYSDVDSGRYYALPVNKVAEILDNFAIDYSSRKNDGLKQKLESLRMECLELYQAGNYKKDSLKALGEALAKAEQLTEQEKFQPEEIQQVCQELQEARDKLIPEMGKIQKLIYVLAGLIALLCIWLLILLILNHKDKKKECLRQMGSGDSAGNTAAMVSPSFSSSPENAGLQETAEPGPQTDSDGMDEKGKRLAARRSASGRELSWQEALQQPEDQEKTIGLSYYRENGASVKKNRQVFSRRAEGLKLMQVGSGQEAIVDKPEYIIGKNPKQADFFVSGNQAVSRKHACIFWQKDAYYLSDLGSANGTYVRGEQVKEGTPVRLNHRDTVMLADEEFSVEIFRRKEDINGIRN